MSVGVCECFFVLFFVGFFFFFYIPVILGQGQFDWYEMWSSTVSVIVQNMKQIDS